MRAGEPSFTTQASAGFRALHAHLARCAAIHDDSLAFALLGFEPGDAVELFKAIPEFESVCAYFALRHRIAEDRLLAAIEDGVRTVVNLGAGLDSFAVRNPGIVSDLEYYEVDHPDTQGWKLHRFDELGLAAPEVRYVAVDFDRESIMERLRAHGFDAKATTFFTWLGISQYVPRQAACATLDLVRSVGASSQIVFAFIAPGDAVPDRDSRLNELFAMGSAERGEPWIAYYSASDISQLLGEREFASVTHFEPDELAGTYYADQHPPVRPMDAWRIVHAVGPGDSRSDTGRVPGP